MALRPNPDVLAGAAAAKLLVLRPRPLTTTRDRLRIVFPCPLRFLHESIPKWTAPSDPTPPAMPRGSHRKACRNLGGFERGAADNSRQTRPQDKTPALSTPDSEARIGVFGSNATWNKPTRRIRRTQRRPTNCRPAITRWRSRPERGSGRSAPMPAGFGTGRPRPACRAGNWCCGMPLRAIHVGRICPHV